MNIKIKVMKELYDYVEITMDSISLEKKEKIKTNY
jgi:hypothetical protein